VAAINPELEMRLFMIYPPLLKDLR
jgi:hypothetical protein